MSYFSQIKIFKINLWTNEIEISTPDKNVSTKKKNVKMFKLNKQDYFSSVGALF